MVANVCKYDTVCRRSEVSLTPLSLSVLLLAEVVHRKLCFYLFLMTFTLRLHCQCHCQCHWQCVCHVFYSAWYSLYMCTVLKSIKVQSDLPVDAGLLWNWNSEYFKDLQVILMYILCLLLKHLFTLIHFSWFYSFMVWSVFYSCSSRVFIVYLELDDIYWIHVSFL